GGCVPLVCDPSDQFCGADGNAYYCDGTGTVATLRATCQGPNEDAVGDGGAGGATGDGDLHEHCQDNGSTAACYLDPCLKGQPYCANNHIAICNAQGTGPVDAGSD